MRLEQDLLDLDLDRLGHCGSKRTLKPSLNFGSKECSKECFGDRMLIFD